MRNRRRMVRKIATGEVYIESDHRLWQQDNDAYRADPTAHPYPMPEDHRMFRRPDEYGCRPVREAIAAQREVESGRRALA